MDTSNNPTRQAYGNMSVAPSGPTHVSMISESNILDASTYNAFTMHYERKHTKLLKIWKVTSTAALPWNGTTQKAMLISLWLNTLWNKWQNMATLRLWNHNTARIRRKPSNMEKITKHLPHSMTVPYWMRQERNESNKLSVAFSIMHGQWIQLY